MRLLSLLTNIRAILSEPTEALISKPSLRKFHNKIIIRERNVEIIHKMFIIIWYNVLCLIVRSATIQRKIKERNS